MDRLCKCGCDREVTSLNIKTKYLPGHNTKITHKGKLRVPRYTKICACGCGGEFTSKNPKRQFLHGHNNKGKTFVRPPGYSKKLSEAHKPYWTPEEYIEWYAKVDYTCRVVWDYELDEFENEMLDRINQGIFI